MAPTKDWWGSSPALGHSELQTTKAATAHAKRWNKRMRIYDPESKRCLNSVTLFLTPDEASDLGFSANDLADNPKKHHHHVSSSDCKTEITVAVHTPDNLAQFDEESKRIISEKK